MNTEWKFEKHPIDYGVALESMEQRVTDIIAGEKPNLIWFLEHNDVYTAGTSAQDADLLVRQFPVFNVGRGGKYTYHGPGQRVIYPIVKLKDVMLEVDIRKYIQILEQSIINTMKDLSIDAYLIKDRIGVWTDKGKIASIGVRIRRGIAFHGVAVNINPKLENFEGIVPCGISDASVTSIAKFEVPIEIPEFDSILAKKLQQSLSL